MSKHSNSARGRATGQIALTHRQRRRPRGEVYRQPPRMRARTQIAVQSLETATSGASRAPEPSNPVYTMAADVALALDPTTAPLEPPDMDATSLEAASPAAQPVMDMPTPSASQSSERMPRRTRTLADVVQPRRDSAMNSGTLSSPSLPSMSQDEEASSNGPLSDPALPPLTISSEAPAASADTPPVLDSGEAASAMDTPLDSTPPTVPDDTTSDLGSQPDAVVDAVPASPPLISIPPPRGTRLSHETAPIAAIEGTAATIRARTRVGNPWGAHPAGMKDDDEAPTRFRRAVRRGSLALSRRVALGHAVAGVVLAVVASALVLLAQPVGVWLLALAALALASGWLASLLLWWRRSAPVAVVVLALAQIGALAWAFTLLGPRATFMVLAAPAVALALRAGGRWPALFASTGIVAVFVAFQIAASLALQPIFTPNPLAVEVGDTLAVALGLALLLAELLVAAAIRARSEAAARARLYEIRLLRERIGAVRGEIEDGSELLDEVLARALRGRGLDPIAVEGPLSLIATSINAAAERMRTLQQDRADRLRLESAVRALARALERGWLGMPWTWPEPSGTLLDEVVGLLRTPRPADSLADALIERRASPHSGPLAPPPAQFDYAGPEPSALVADMFGSGGGGAESDR